MLTRDALRVYCLGCKGAYSDFPFGDEAEVFKVNGKMFALLPANATPPTINLKCDPLLAEMLRQTYAAVKPGYHMNKRHWNTVISDGTIPDDELLEMIEHSYTLVVQGLTKAQRQALGAEADS